MDKQLKYGVGLECSLELAGRDDIDLILSRVSSLEIIPESYFFNKRESFVKQLGVSQIPIVAHCVELSLGSDEALNREHLDRVKSVMDQMNCVIFSDHLCMTNINDIEIGQLTTLPFTQEVADVVCRKLEIIQKEVQLPFMLENITNRFLYPHNTLSEPEFINSILRRSGCGFLLDVTNLYINSVNFGFDPYQWFDQILAQSVMGIHLAGGIKEEGMLYDTHSRPVPKPVWTLLDYVLQRCHPDVVIIEWDQHMPATERLIKEVQVAETLVAKSFAKQNSKKIPKILTSANPKSTKKTLNLEEMFI